MSSKNVVVELPRINLKKVQIKVHGDSPLICHAWSEKAKHMMLQKQMKKAVSGKAAKAPEEDFFDSLHWLTEKPQKASSGVPNGARFGFPSVGFKATAVSACRFTDGIKMTEVRGSFHIDGDMVEIKGTPVMREDMVRIGMGTADIRYRGEFPEWSAVLNITYNENALSIEQIMNLFNVGGFGVGIGEWRPERDGSFGRFHVA